MSLNCMIEIVDGRTHLGLIIGIVVNSLAGLNSRIVVD